MCRTSADPGAPPSTQETPEETMTTARTACTSPRTLHVVDADNLTGAQPSTSASPTGPPSAVTGTARLVPVAPPDLPALAALVVATAAEVVGLLALQQFLHHHLADRLP